MNELITFWNRCFNLAKKFDDIQSWQAFMHQAYGAAELFMALEPDAAPMVNDLWESDWRPAFMNGAMAAQEDGNA